MSNDEYESQDLLSLSLSELADRFDQAADKVNEQPTDWMEKYFYVPIPRNPITGERLPTGPIVFAPHQKRIINEALSKDKDGRYNYSTIIYSAPKKSGKSATASAAALWVAAHTPFGQIYVLGNDGKNSKDRLYGPIFRCLNFHRGREMPLGKSRINLTEAILPNNSHIEAIPVDPSGEAGSEPAAVFISEAWGFDTEAKRRLFSEMTISPTLWGYSFRWIETYAGYQGQSDLLWELYNTATKEGEPHPEFTDLVGREGEPVVWVNKKASMFCYWDTVPRMPWQLEPAFYESEANVLSPDQFRRMHHNQWVSPVGAYIQGSWWDSCADENLLPLLIGSDTPCILAVDAALTGDCAALVLVTRDPRLPDTDVAVRYCKIFKPGPKRAIQIEADIGREIRRLSRLYNVVCVAYDAYQMEGLAQNYRQGKVTLTEEEKYGKSQEQLLVYLEEESRYAQRWFYQFGQNAPRAVADKQLHDMVLAKQLHWNPNDRDSDIAIKGNEETLTKHIKQAGVKNSGNQMRIEKLSNDAKIDAAVALAMATKICLHLNLDNRELHADNLMRQYNAGQLTYEQYLSRIAQANAQQRVS